MRTLRFAYPLAAVTLLACAATHKIDTPPELPSDAADTGSMEDISIVPSDTDPVFDVTGEVTPPCKNLQCKQVVCKDGKTTSVSGTVHAPTPSTYGKADPLYNVIVYVPNATPLPFTKGVSCDKCGALASGEPLVTALTGVDGKFRLENMPVGTDIPLIVQVGRWRRQVTIPTVAECADTPLPDELTRLPRSSKEGDIPQMAIVSSVYDPTECIMRKIGVEDSEFTTPMGKGRIHMFKGNGADIGTGAPAGNMLWTSLDKLKIYDIVAFPCASYPSTTEMTGGSSKNIVDYTAAGGRIFITDLSYPIIQSSVESKWVATATWGSGSYSNPASIDTSFPKGDSFAKWLQGVGATTTLGSINLTGTYARFTAVKAPAQRWMYSSSTVQTYSFNTPVDLPAADQCGRVVYSSFHVAASGGGSLYPAECTTGPLTAQEKALEFMLFDLASCVQKDTEAPKPPPPR